MSLIEIRSIAITKETPFGVLLLLAQQQDARMIRHERRNLEFPVHTG